MGGGGRQLLQNNISLQEEAMASEVDVKHKSTVTQSAFDLEKKPSKYAGVKSPPADPNEVAREVFNFCPSPESSTSQFYSPLNYSGPFFPLYAQSNHFGFPCENFESLVSSSSPSQPTSSPNANSTMAAAAMLPPYHQYAMPIPFHYFLGSQYPHMYSAAGLAGDYSQPGSEDAAPKLPATQPVSVKVLSSSNQVNGKGESIIQPESQMQKSDVRRRKHHSNTDYSYGHSIASLSSPLKRMKVIDEQERTADESISAYFADVSANSTCSDDDDAEENEEVSNIMSLLLKSEQQRRRNTTLPLAGLGRITRKEKEDLEEITGTSDLGALLNSGLETLKANGGKTTACHNSTAQSPPPDICSENYVFSDGHVGVTSMDVHDIDSAVTASQQDNYFLPSLDTLLNIGEDTIITMKAAMNLDIQGVVEIATEDSNKDIVHSKSNVTHPSTDTDEIQVD